MDNFWIASQPWWTTLKINDDGIWAINDNRCAVGVVLLARRNNDIALVRKAIRSDYEFSGSFALPGGVVRGTANETFIASLKRSMLHRVALECGLSQDHLIEVDFIRKGPSPVTGYTAKGKERRTLVVALQGLVDREFALQSVDRSIDQAGWYQSPIPWSNIAPANRLILASALATQISQNEKRDAEACIDDALVRCNQWAADVGLPIAKHPWKD